MVTPPTHQQHQNNPHQQDSLSRKHSIPKPYCTYTVHCIMAAEDLCIGCSQPLVIAVEDSDEEIAAGGSVTPGIVDDVKLSCGHHYHWYSYRLPLSAQSRTPVHPFHTNASPGPASQKNTRQTKPLPKQKNNAPVATRSSSIPPPESSW